MGTGPWGYDDGEFTDEAFFPVPAARRPASVLVGKPPARRFTIRERKAKPVSRTHSHEPSAWSCSAAKRIFDCACVVLALPVLIPILLAVAAAVRFTSPGPVLFLQKRVGRNGRTFTILKFRTMVDVADGTHHAITTLDNQRFTSVGPFLRHWKLDEMPQLANVLLGQMSMVGPRPKMPEHEIFDILCRPGITGMATLAFAEEESILARVQKDRLDHHYHNVILPAKRQMDAEYMRGATFASDFRLLVASVLRRWNPATAERFVAAITIGEQDESASLGAQDSPEDMAEMPSATPATGWMAFG
jgi:lipopolysaccharide/colanic/teichoic acid biosynthesis glycosyltransferase